MINIHLWSTSWCMLAYSITISCPTSDAPNAYKLPRETFFLLSNKYLLESEAHPWIEWSMCLQPGCSRVGVKYSRQLVPMCYKVARHHIFEQQWKLLCHLELQSTESVFNICHKYRTMRSTAHANPFWYCKLRPIPQSSTGGTYFQGDNTYLSNCASLFAF